MGRNYKGDSMSVIHENELKALLGLVEIIDNDVLLQIGFNYFLQDNFNMELHTLIKTLQNIVSNFEKSKDKDNKMIIMQEISISHLLD
jgi:outer membrane protein W